MNGKRLELLKRINKEVDGWLTIVEADALYRWASAKNHGNVVEIGSYKGKSTIVIAKAINDRIIHAIDHFEGNPEHKKRGITGLYDDFLVNVERFGVKDRVNILKMDSKRAVELFDDDTISFLFIDGDHAYPSVRADFDNFFPKLMDDGVIIFHDSVAGCGWDGPTRVVKEIIESGIMRPVEIAGSCTVLAKPGQCIEIPAST